MAGTNDIQDVIGGVDPHKDVHAAAALSVTGQLLGTALFPTTRAGHGQLLAWLTSQGRLIRVGVEGTGSYGSGLMRHLRAAGISVVEVNRPNRQLRRQRGKSDTVDAEAAARAALSGTATGTPKSQDGMVEAIRLLRLARRSAMKARTQTGNQIHAVVQSAPTVLRELLRGQSLARLVPVVRRFRWRAPMTPLAAARFTLKSLADRWAALEAELRQLDHQLELLVSAAAPHLVALIGVGTETGGALLVAIGDNPDRLHSDLEGTQIMALLGAKPAGGMCLPVIGLTRRGDLKTKLAAFEAGVDDIVTVPFAPEELLARVIALVRRAYSDAVTFTPVIKFGELEIDILNRTVRDGTIELHLTSLEQSLLYLLAANAGRVVTREEILDTLWGVDYVAESNVVDRQIQSLRARLQDNWREPRFIATVPGRGYRFLPTFTPTVTTRRHPETASANITREHRAGRARPQQPAARSSGRPLAEANSPPRL